MAEERTAETASAALAPWLKRQLQQLLTQKGHALLLAGPSGLGQFDLALALARAWLCENPSSGEGACGQCPSCHAVAVHAHADLKVLMPDILSLELGWPIDPKTQDKIDKKELKPSKFIRVEATRDAVAFTQLTRARSPVKVVLVYPAERMNNEAANTLLKTLEEPTGDVRFVLATEAAHQLLPTIRSRCLTHAMAWPSEDEVRPWLAAEAEASGVKAVSALAVGAWMKASGGRPEDALALARQGLTAEIWSRLPKALARADWGAMSAWEPAQQLAILQKLCHDLLAVATGAPPRFFDADDLPNARHLPSLSGWAKDLSQQMRTVEHPYNAQLMQEAWAARTREVLCR